MLKKGSKNDIKTPPILPQKIAYNDIPKNNDKLVKFALLEFIKYIKI